MCVCVCVLAYTSTAEPWLVPGSAATYYRVSEVMSSGQTCHPSDLPLSQVISAASGLRRPSPDPLESPEVRSVALMQRTASSTLCLLPRSSHTPIWTLPFSLRFSEFGARGPPLTSPVFVEHIFCCCWFCTFAHFPLFRNHTCLSLFFHMSNSQR